MKRRSWFLPEMPDVHGLLCAQVAVTREGLVAFEAWTRGDEGAADAVRDAEHRGDDAKRELLVALRGAFVTPLEPEDLFSLSRGADRILNYARDLVNEASVMERHPDTGIIGMAAELASGVDDLEEAIAKLRSDPDAAMTAADSAIVCAREVEHLYWRGMAAASDHADRGERIAQRELYRRCARIGETVVDVAERVVYAVVKQS